MVNTMLSIGYDDGEALQSKRHQVMMENKESVLRKAFLVVMMIAALVVVGSNLDQYAPSGNNLFGERSLKPSFCGLCGKKGDTPAPAPTLPPTPSPTVDDGFTLRPWDTRISALPLTAGVTLQYKAHVPAGLQTRTTLVYNTAGADLFVSFSSTQPAADGATTATSCHNVGGAYIATCTIAPQSQNKVVYIWIVGKGTPSPANFDLGDGVAPGA